MVPSPRAGFSRRRWSVVRYSSSIEVSSPVCALHGEFVPVGGLGQPGCGVGVVGAEVEGCGLSGPGNRHATAVAPALRVAGRFPDGVLEDGLGQVLHFGEAEFVALVDVGAAAHGEHEQGCGAGAAGAEVQVDDGSLGLVPLVGYPACDGLAGVAAGVAHDVVVGEHSGGRCSHVAERGEGVVDDRAEVLEVPAGHEEVEVGSAWVRGFLERSAGEPTRGSALVPATVASSRRSGATDGPWESGLVEDHPGSEAGERGRRRVALWRRPDAHRPVG